MTDNGDRTGSFIIPPAPEKVAGKQLQQRINKRSFLAGRALLAGVTGTMDAAISYPIQRRTENTYFQAVAGINSIMLAAPPPDHHMLVSYGTCQMTDSTGVGSLPVEAALWMQSGENASLILAPTLQPQNSQILLWCVPVTIRAIRYFVPFINCEIANGADRIRGVPTVYLPYGKTLWYGFDAGLTGLQFTNLYLTTLTLPDTQPFSSILDL